MSNVKIIANPYALLIDNVVTEVVYMQDYSEEEIKKTLLLHEYDEVVNCSEYGDHLLVGYVKINNWIVPASPHPLWVFDDETGTWDPPINWNKNMDGWFSLCATCEDEDHGHDSSLITLSSKKVKSRR